MISNPAVDGNPSIGGDAVVMEEPEVMDWKSSSICESDW